MKFTVEVEEFYLNEEDSGRSLETTLRDYIINEVVSKIWEKIKDEADNAITMKVETKVRMEMESQINKRIAEIIDSETIFRDKKEILISDYLREQFERNIGWNKPDDIIRDKAKQFGDEMKKRYDFLYANEIVQQMHKIGILKEEIYTNLLENKKD
jgi:hypothetical protein